MAEFQVFKETALPSTLVPNGLYFITSADPNYVEVYLVANDGSVARRLLTEADVQAIVDGALVGIEGTQIVDDIAARDALTLTANAKILVLDATADTTVDSGAATYVYNITTDTFTKTSEEESQDVILDWNNIVNGPSSTPAQIDAAVVAMHTHANMTELNSIGQDAAGNLTYNGDLPATPWASTNW